MKRFIIGLCEAIILKLDSNYTFPEQRLNYKKAVDTILAQSETGRRAFYKTLFSKMNIDELNECDVHLTVELSKKS